MAYVQRVAKDTDMSVINDILEKDGCLVIEGILSPDELQAFKHELNPLLNVTQDCQGDFYGYKTKRLSGLIAKSPQSWQMAAHPIIMSVMDSILLKGCDAYQLNLTQAISIGPGEPKQVIHRDDSMFPFEHPAYETMVNCMWAVDDFTFKNGATNLVPGSHKWSHDREAEPSDIAYGEMKAGSVLIYVGSLLHNGGANITDKYRTGVVLSYSLGWLKQAENQFLAVPQEIAQSAPETVQRLMGYFVHKPNLGCVEGQDPIKLLQESGKKPALFEEFLPDNVKPLLKEYRASQQASAA